MLRRKFVAAALVAALAASQVSAQCWTGEEVSAARIRDLQTALMVGALQCRGTSYDVLPAFNRFVRAARGTIAKQNDLLRAHFADERDGAGAYDRFTTALANGHSQGAGAEDYCASMRDVAAAAEDAANSRNQVEELTALAERFADRVRGVGRSCSVETASR